MRIALIFDKTRPDTTGTYFERAAKELGLQVEHWWLKEASQIPKAFDLYLRIDHGDDYLKPLPSALHPAVFYAIDTHLPHSWRKIRQMAKDYELVFCCHKSAAHRLRNAEWLPVGCDLSVHSPQGQAQVWDLAFVGNDGGLPRKFYLQMLRERYPNSFIGSADFTQLGRIYGQARIGFNYSIANDVNMRVFEVLAAQTLLVTNALRGNEFSQLGLEEGKHLVFYRSPQQLLDTIDYYLNHTQKRQAIARAGSAIVRQRHTYTHRLCQLLKRVGERLGIPVPLLPQEISSCAFL
ncbi:MAG: glycosyltransferase [Candidatus Omnitrophica bacterium]|nr:glycosyltransferase [Candidatus Omnitrophota bacterium]